MILPFVVKKKLDEFFINFTFNCLPFKLKCDKWTEELLCQNGTTFVFKVARMNKNNRQIWSPATNILLK